jgi:hypothetical protein
MATKFYNKAVDHGIAFDYTVNSVTAQPQPNRLVLNFAQQPTLAVGDIIYFKKGSLEIPMFYIGPVVGVGFPNLVSYDYRIYPSPVGLTSSLWSNYTFDALVRNDVPNYSIESEVSRAVYSKNMIEYYKKNRYNINVRGLKSRYLGDFQSLANSSALFVGDDCEFNGDGVAYKVVLIEDSFDAFRNNFTKDLSFKLANV